MYINILECEHGTTLAINGGPALRCNGCTCESWALTRALGVKAPAPLHHVEEWEDLTPTLSLSVEERSKVYQRWE